MNIRSDAKQVFNDISRWGYDTTKNTLTDMSRWGNAAGSVIGNIATLVSGSGGTSSSIRDRYLNGFFGDTTQFVPGVFSRLFDEPTYLTFRIEFNFDAQLFHNVTQFKDGEYNKIFDRMPEPLLSIPVTPSNSYSTYEYLENSLGESMRAKMLYRFVKSLQDIQDNYPYYFTEISGLDKLSSVNPGKGIRLPEDTAITLKCYEGLDLKITQLMQLYRKIAWDDVYQRWILPDMMRFFNMKIYVSELRLFHTMSRSKRDKGILYDFINATQNSMNATSYDQLNSNKNIFDTTNRVLNGVTALSQRVLGEDNMVSRYLDVNGQILDTYNDVVGAFKEGFETLCNNAINNVMPTLCYDCHMCEFDISDTAKHISSLSSHKSGIKSPEPELVIKIGQVEEIQMFPLSKALEQDDKNHKYIVKYDDDTRNLQGGAFISDEYLRRDATPLKNDAPGEIKNGNDFISATHKRINPKMSNPDDDSYRIFGNDRSAAARSIFSGLVNMLTTDRNRSKATEKVHRETPIERPKPSTELKKDRYELTLNEDALKNDSEAMYKKYNTSDTLLSPETVSAPDQHEVTQTGYGEGVIIYEPEEHEQQNVPAGRLISESHYNDAEKLSIATSSFRDLQYLVYDNKVIEGLDVDEATKQALKDNLFTNILEYISLSTAADPRARDIATAILDLSKVPQSAATEKKQ